MYFGILIGMTPLLSNTGKNNVYVVNAKFFSFKVINAINVCCVTVASVIWLFSAHLTKTSLPRTRGGAVEQYLST